MPSSKEDAHPAHGYYVVGETEGEDDSLEMVIRNQTAFFPDSNFFFPTPRFSTDRVQHLHYSRSGDAPAPKV